jgi:hypothetical protein
MKSRAWVVALAAGAVFAIHGAASAAEAGAPAVPEAVGAIVVVTGEVQVGRDGKWQPAAAEQKLFEGQSIKTGAKAAAEILFAPNVPARVGEGTEIKVEDLLLKARLEKAKAKIAAPTDSTKVEMQVTPLTGVRGTDKTEEKAEDLKREHYWNESAPAK